MIKPISRAISPVSVSTITSDDSSSTIEDLTSDSSSDFLNYKILATTRTTINMNNPSEQIPSMSQFEEDIDNLSKSAESDFTCNNSGFSKPNTSPISDNTFNNSNIVGENVVLN